MTVAEGVIVKPPRFPRNAALLHPLRTHDPATQFFNNLQEFAGDPLPDVECRSIAKSCAKYSLRQYSEITFSEIQTARNTKRWHPSQPNYDYRGRAETAALMVNTGFSKLEVAAHFGVSLRTIERDLGKVQKTT